MSTRAPADRRHPHVPPPPLPVLDKPWSVRVMAAEGRDLDMIHDWMLRPHVETNWDQGWTRETWRATLREQLEGDHSRPCLFLEGGTPLAYLEIYRVVRDRLAALYPYRDHDLGVHIAIGDHARIGRGLGRRILRGVAEGLLAADPECTRVVAEPDVKNDASIKAFTAAGFRHRGAVAFPHKTSALMVHPRTEADLP